jgi:hypothetical protein
MGHVARMKAEKDNNFGNKISCKTSISKTEKKMHRTGSGSCQMSKPFCYHSVTYDVAMRSAHSLYISSPAFKTSVLKAFIC